MGIITRPWRFLVGMLPPYSLKPFYVYEYIQFPFDPPYCAGISIGGVPDLRPIV